MDQEKLTINYNNSLLLPKTVGWYEVNTYRIAFTEKPNIIKRFFMRSLLGLKWIDNKE